MRKLFVALSLLVALCAYSQDQTKETLAPAPEVADVTPAKSPFELTLSLKYANKYMSKGYINTDGDMLFPEARLSYKGLYIGVWLAWDMNDKHRDEHVDRGNVEETDIYLGYDGLSFDNIGTFDIRWTYYDYPHRGGGNDENGIYRHWSDSKTSDISIDFTCTNEYVKDFKPGVQLIWYYAYHNSAGLRFHTGYDVNLSFISEKLTWSNLLEAWYGDQWFRGRNYHQSGLFSAQYTAKFNYALNEHVTFGPYFQIAHFIEKSYSEYACKTEGNHDYNWLVGFNVTTRF